MEKILCVKIDQLKEMNDFLVFFRFYIIFVYFVYDFYWGIGLDFEKIVYIVLDVWLGQNKFGKLLQCFVDK